MSLAALLTRHISLVCPIYGVSIGDDANKATWRIDYKPEATVEQKAAAQAACQSFTVATPAPAARGWPARNYIINPEFEVRTNGDSFAFTNSGGVTANRWHVGPGPGGSVTVSFPTFAPDQIAVPGYPERFMRLQWTVAPTEGEAQYKPGFRWTFLEHYMSNSRELMGGAAGYRLYARVAGGAVPVKPIFWINYQNGSYWILQDQPEATLDQTWRCVFGTQQIPPVPANQPMDQTHYVGFGLDFTFQTGPTIELAKFAVWSADPDVVENRPIELERMMSA